MPQIVAAYLQWKYNDTAADPRQTETPRERSSYDLDLECIDYFSAKKSVVIPRTSTQTAAEALILHGYFGSSPDQPTFAISLATLQLFHDIRRFKASYSVEAFTKMVCYKYMVRIVMLGHSAST